MPEGCKREGCDFAHVKLSEENAKILASYVKSRTPSPKRGQTLCNAFQKGDCSYGDKCRFKHGENDKRPKFADGKKGKDASAAPAVEAPDQA